MVFALVLLVGCSAGTDSARSVATSQHDKGIDPRLAAKLQGILDTERERFAAGGASAAVVIPGEGIWLGASGVADPRTSEPVTTKTAFAIGSVTKTFIAALVLDLAEDRLLSLDDRLARWLPSFPRAKRITIRELLNHTSGVFDITEDRSFLQRAARAPPRAMDPPPNALLRQAAAVQTGD
jgi:D-alanyl-D-alanine carboxypeptidase